MSFFSALKCPKPLCLGTILFGATGQKLVRFIVAQCGTESGMAMVKYVKVTPTSGGILTLYKRANFMMSLDDLVTLHEKGEQSKAKEFKRLVRREQSINGSPGMVYECQGVMLNGTPYVEKCVAAQSGTTCYLLVCYFVNNQNSADANNIFSTVSSSMKVRN